MARENASGKKKKKRRYSCVQVWACNANVNIQHLCHSDEGSSETLNVSPPPSSPPLSRISRLTFVFRLISRLLGTCFDLRKLSKQNEKSWWRQNTLKWLQNDSTFDPPSIHSYSFILTPFYHWLVPFDYKSLLMIHRTRIPRIESVLSLRTSIVR